MISYIALKNPKKIAGPKFDPELHDLLRGDEYIFFLSKCYFFKF